MKFMLILSLVCFTFSCMVYGFICLGNLKHSAQNQRNGIEKFIKKQVLTMFDNVSSMYAIAKKMNVSAMTIKRFLVSQS